MFMYISLLFPHCHAIDNLNFLLSFLLRVLSSVKSLFLSVAFKKYINFVRAYCLFLRIGRLFFCILFCDGRKGR